MAPRQPLSLLERLRTRPVLTLREATLLMIGDTSVKSSAAEYRRVYQRMLDANAAKKLALEPGNPRRVRRAALVVWACRLSRVWAKNLGVSFKQEISLESWGNASAKEGPSTHHVSDKSLRMQLELKTEENERLRAGLQMANQQLEEFKRDAELRAKRRAAGREGGRESGRSRGIFSERERSKK